MKICSQCGIEKNESEFIKNNKKSDGLRCECKICSLKYYKKYKENNVEKLKTSQKKYREKNKEKVKKWHKEWEEKNREKRKEQMKKWHNKNYENTKEEKKEKCKEWRENNIEKVKNYRKEYNEKNNKYRLDYARNYAKENREKRKEQMILYRIENKQQILKTSKQWREKNKEKIKNRLKTDNEYKIKITMHRSFKNSIRKKTKSFFKYTNLAYADYIDYFKNNFPVEFSEITEKGKYHIDHIIPCAIYDFKNPDEIKLCWQPENLRIIPAKENLKKSSKLDFDLIKKYKIEHLLPKQYRQS